MGISNLLQSAACCCGAPVTLEPIPDCAQPVPATHVTITRVSDGVVVFDGNTDGSGRITVTLTVGAPYDLTIDGYGSPRWLDVGRFAGPVGTGPATVVLRRAPGYICYGGCNYPLSNRLTLDGARDSPVLLAAAPNGAAIYWPADIYGAVVPAEGTYSTPDGVDAYGARGSAVPGWTLDVEYDPGSGDPFQEVFSVIGTADCSPFLVTFPHTGTGGAPDWTLTEAPAVP